MNKIIVFFVFFALCLFFAGSVSARTSGDLKTCITRGGSEEGSCTPQPTRLQGLQEVGIVKDIFRQSGQTYFKSYRVFAAGGGAITYCESTQNKDCVPPQASKGFSLLAGVIKEEHPSAFRNYAVYLNQDVFEQALIVSSPSPKVTCVPGTSALTAYPHIARDRIESDRLFYNICVKEITTPSQSTPVPTPIPQPLPVTYTTDIVVTKAVASSLPLEAFTQQGLAESRSIIALELTVKNISSQRFVGGLMGEGETMSTDLFALEPGEELTLAKKILYTPQRGKLASPSNTPHTKIIYFKTTSSAEDPANNSFALSLGRNEAQACIEERKNPESQGTVFARDFYPFGVRTSCLPASPSAKENYLLDPLTVLNPVCENNNGAIKKTICPSGSACLPETGECMASPDLVFEKITLASQLENPNFPLPIEYHLDVELKNNSVQEIPAGKMIFCFSPGSPAEAKFMAFTENIHLAVNSVSLCKGEYIVSVNLLEGIKANKALNKRIVFRTSAAWTSQATEALYKVVAVLVPEKPRPAVTEMLRTAPINPSAIIPIIETNYLNNFKQVSLPKGQRKGCYDSDNGQDTTKKGLVYDPGVFGSVAGIPGVPYREISGYDSCVNSQTIREYYCGSDTPGPDIKGITLPCPNGTICNEGACVLVNNLVDLVITGVELQVAGVKENPLSASQIGLNATGKARIKNIGAVDVPVDTTLGLYIIPASRSVTYSNPRDYPSIAQEPVHTRTFWVKTNGIRAGEEKEFSFDTEKIGFSLPLSSSGMYVIETNLPNIGKRVEESNYSNNSLEFAADNKGIVCIDSDNGAKMEKTFSPSNETLVSAVIHFNNEGRTVITSDYHASISSKNAGTCENNQYKGVFLECSPGKTVQQSGFFGSFPECVPSPTAEVCDGKDNDGDGLADEEGTSEVTSRLCPQDFSCSSLDRKCVQATATDLALNARIVSVIPINETITVQLIYPNKKQVPLDREVEIEIIITNLGSQRPGSGTSVFVKRTDNKGLYRAPLETSDVGFNVEIHRPVPLGLNVVFTQKTKIKVPVGVNALRLFLKPLAGENTTNNTKDITLPA